MTIFSELFTFAHLCNMTVAYLAGCVFGAALIIANKWRKQSKAMEEAYDNIDIRSKEGVR